MDGDAHVEAVLSHAGKVVDLVMTNDAPLPPDAVERYAKEGSRPVHHDAQALAAVGVDTVSANLISSGPRIRHDARKLARALLKLARRAVRH